MSTNTREMLERVTAPYRLEVTIPAVPKLINRQSRASYHAEAMQRRQWRELVCLSVGHRKPTVPLKKARVIIEVHRAGKEPDPDNLVASCKPILDGLQPQKSYRRNGKLVVSRGCGVLADDQVENFEGGEAKVKFVPAKKRDQRVVIKVEEVSA